MGTWGGLLVFMWVENLNRRIPRLDPWSSEVTFNFFFLRMKVNAGAVSDAITFNNYSKLAAFSSVTL